MTDRLAGSRDVSSAPTPLQGTLIDAPQERTTTDDYYTPQHVFDALGLTFDIDVCAPVGGVPWIPARRSFTKADDGLSQPWEGRVWMNPPYSNATPWVRRFIQHGNGIALVGAAKSVWHQELWAAADACAFPFQRMYFVGGEVYMPVWFAAFGPECVAALRSVGVTRVKVA